MQGDILQCTGYQHHTHRRDAFSTCARCASHTLYTFIPNVFINTCFNCTGELVSPCHFVTLLLKFNVPALEELAASSPRGICATFDTDVAMKGKGKLQL